MSLIKTFQLCLSFFTIISLTACIPLKKETTDIRLKETPRAFSVSGADKKPTESKEDVKTAIRSRPQEKWWKNFRLGHLNQLIDRAMANNPDLNSALYRLKAAKLLEEQVKANSGIFVAGEFGADRARGYSSNVAYNVNAFSFTTAASYELDLWGKQDALEKAAALDVSALEYDIQTLSMSLCAEIVSAYMNVIMENATLNLLKRQLKVNKTYLDLIELRFSLGLASALDVYQQRQQAAALRAKIPLSESSRRTGLHKLALLTGSPPPALDTVFPGDLPQIPHLPDTGLPADILEQRPDVMAAKIKILAMDERIFAAMADRYPSLTLSAVGGFSASDFGKLFEQWVWTLVSEVSATLWDGNRKHNEVEKKKAEVNALVEDYTAAALTAFKEVEDALILEKSQAEYIRELEAQMDLAEKSLDEARVQYEAGQVDYLRVLSALSSLQNLEISMVSAKALLISHRIRLHRALGGGYSPGSIKTDNTTGIP